MRLEDIQRARSHLEFVEANPLLQGHDAAYRDRLRKKIAAARLRHRADSIRLAYCLRRAMMEEKAAAAWRGAGVTVARIDSGDWTPEREFFEIAREYVQGWTP